VDGVNRKREGHQVRIKMETARRPCQGPRRIVQGHHAIPRLRIAQAKINRGLLAPHGAQALLVWYFSGYLRVGTAFGFTS
jgi:hypothetical protein